MKLKSFIIPIVFLSSSLAFSTTNSKSHQKSIPEKGPAFVKILQHDSPACKKLILSEQQKKDLAVVIFDYKEKMIDLKANYQHAKLNWIKLLHDSTATMEEAQTATAELITKSNEKTSLKMMTKTKVLFEIIDPEQRLTAYACLMSVKHAKKHQHKAKGQSKGGHHSF